MKDFLLKLLLTKEEKKKLKLKGIQSGVDNGHVAYSWLNGGVANCTCEACNTTWDLENTYIPLKSYLSFLDHPNIKSKLKEK